MDNDVTLVALNPSNFLPIRSHLVNMQGNGNFNRQRNGNFNMQRNGNFAMQRNRKLTIADGADDVETE